jgi:hypothetical protein
LAEPAPADPVDDDLRSAVDLAFRLAEQGRGEGLSSALDLLLEELLAPARFSERLEAPPTPGDAYRLFGSMLSGRRGAWRRSDG